MPGGLAGTVAPGDAAPSGTLSNIIGTRGTIEVIGARGTIGVFHPAPFRIFGILDAFDIRDRPASAMVKDRGFGGEILPRDGGWSRRSREDMRMTAVKAVSRTVVQAGPRMVEGDGKAKRELALGCPIFTKGGFFVLVVSKGCKP